MYGDRSGPDVGGECNCQERGSSATWPLSTGFDACVYRKEVAIDPDM